MSELNKDGLIPGQEVDFETIARVNNNRKKAAKNEASNNSNKVRGHKKPNVSDAQKAAEQKEA